MLRGDSQLLELISDIVLTSTSLAKKPLESNLKLATVQYDKMTRVTGDGILHDINSYQRLISELMYVTVTSPDINYVVHTLSQFMQMPKKSH